MSMKGMLIPVFALAALGLAVGLGPQAASVASRARVRGARRRKEGLPAIGRLSPVKRCWEVVQISVIE